nr:glycosyl hydrolase family 8 [Roseicella aquatilis]
MQTGSPRLRRRSLIALLAAAPGGADGAETDAARAAWAAFQARFVAPEGRVVDTGNGGVSHSEGQGWGMLLAVRAEDRRAFERLLAWTRRHLRRPGDNLHAWRYRPGGVPPVEDPNNATDGDLCIAWALLEAAHRWGREEHAALGAGIGRDLLRLVVRRVGPTCLLLPGVQGFERPEHVVVNLSYYVFPAFGALARAVPDPAWARLAADGLMLLRLARFGPWDLPPDWLQVARRDGALAPAVGWPPRFSYDAVRVPLWLAWAGLREEPALRQAHRFWSATRQHPPAWVDLQTNAVAHYPAPPGIMALARLAAAAPPGTGPFPESRPSPEAPDYYSAVLTLLAQCAAQDAKIFR